MGDSFLKLQEMCSFSQNVGIEVYGILNTGATLCVSAHGEHAPCNNAHVFFSFHTKYFVYCGVNLLERLT